MSYVEAGFILVLKSAAAVREIIISTLVIPTLLSTKGFITMILADPITHATATYIQTIKQ
jgi:hypothetical protein